jgi:hypothetical protein
MVDEAPTVSAKLILPMTKVVVNTKMLAVVSHF